MRNLELQIEDANYGLEAAKRGAIEWDHPIILIDFVVQEIDITAKCDDIELAVGGLGFGCDGTNIRHQSRQRQRFFSQRIRKIVDESI